MNRKRIGKQQLKDREPVIYCIIEDMDREIRINGAPRILYSLPGRYVLEIRAISNGFEANLCDEMGGVLESTSDRHGTNVPKKELYPMITDILTAYGRRTKQNRRKK